MLMSQVGISVERALSPGIWHAFALDGMRRAMGRERKTNCESRTPAVNINNQVAALGERESFDGGIMYVLRISAVNIISRCAACCRESEK